MQTANKAVAVYYCDRGEDLAAIEIYSHESGDQLTALDSLHCAFKKALNGNTVPPQSAPEIFEIDGLFEAAAGSDPARFSLTMTAAETAVLEPGSYISTPELTLSGGVVVIGSPLLLVIRESTR